MKDHSSGSYLLDVSRLVWRALRGQLPTGIDRVCLAYVRHYGSRSRAVVQWAQLTSILSAQASQQLFSRLLEPGFGTRRELLTLLLAALPSFTRQSFRQQLYFNVGHTGLDRSGHVAWIMRTGVMPVYFVHDLIPLTHPEYCRPGEPEKHHKRIKALLTHGAGIIGNSRDTLDELSDFAQFQNVPQMPPTLVALLGIDWTHPAEPVSDEALSHFVPRRPYFVILGTIEGRKNHLVLLNLWVQLARILHTNCPQLVIIGQRGWECEQAVDMLERCEALRSHVVELPRCDDTLLRAYLKHARALLFPSFVEGYGLPLVEALSYGTPVIASDLDVFRELAGDIPDYLSPIDGVGWMRAIENYVAQNSTMRAAQLRRMAGWKPPTWEDHFARVDDWLEQFRS